MALNTKSIDLEAGSSHYLTAADSATLSPTDDATCEAWVWFESLPSDGNVFIIFDKYSDGTNQHSYRVTLLNDSGTYRIQGISSADGSSDNNVNVAWTPSTSTWYHLAVVFDVGVGTLFYVGGSQQGTTQTMAASIHNGTGALNIGGSAGGSNFDGLIDEVRIWSEARSQAEIAANKDDHIDPETENLNAYWRLNDALTDETGNGNTLSNPNSAGFSSTVPFVGTGDASGRSYGFFM